MHILFLTDNFPPETNAPANRTFEHARVWAAQGHRVTVVTCAPNFPAGRVMAGYRNRLWQSERRDGIRVIRVWSFMAANEGFVLRLLDYLSYMVMAVLAAIFVRRVDVVVGTSPQFFTAVAAWAVGGLKRVPFVFELRDIWPESIRAVGAMRQGRLITWLERLELFLYRRADAVIAVTHAFRENLVLRGIDRSKIHVVTNGVDLKAFCPTPDAGLKADLGLQDKLVAGYIGTQGMAHGLGTLLDAAEMLASRPDLHFLFLGTGAEHAALVQQARDKDLRNVTFLDPVSRSEIARYWSVLDAAIIHLRPDPMFRAVIPSKLFESMAMGVPILMGVEGEAQEIVVGAGAGVPFAPGDARQLAQRMSALMDDPDQRATLARSGQRAAAGYDRDHLARRMALLLADVVAGSTAPRSRAETLSTSRSLRAAPARK